MKNKPNPLHNCPALGKDIPTPRAFNTAYPKKMFFKCPFCDFEIEREEEKK